MKITFPAFPKSLERSSRGDIMKTKVIVIRHCEARGNIDRIFNGHYDGDITENGKKQLACLASRMQEVPFDELYSSPLLRARKTAMAASTGKNLPIQIEDGLIEINGGVWEGKPWKSFPELFPKDSEAWNLRPWDFAPEGGEPMRGVYERIWRTVTDLARRNVGKTICCVSHGCAIRNLLCQAKGYPVEKLNEVEWCDNTAVSVIEFDEDFQGKLILENDNSHLSQNLSTLAGQVWWRKEYRDNMIFE